MRRTLVFLDHQAQWWRMQATLRNNCEAVLASGLRAYAEKQATIRGRLASDFASMWLVGIRDSQLSLPVTWPAKYVSVQQSSSKKVKRRLERNKTRARVISYVDGPSTVPPTPTQPS